MFPLGTKDITAVT